MTAYIDFLAAKRPLALDHGRPVNPADIHPSLFDFQRDLVVWAVRKGRAALLADAGLGKTRMQLEWARLIGQRTLILAPLTVAEQTVDEALAIDLDVVYARRQEHAGPGLTITNYELADHFDPAAFGAIVLDESSILKAAEGVTRNKLIRRFERTHYRLACTATPAPNDIAEIGNHAEFLSTARRRHMLAQFFLHDDQGWRLKGHAREPFFAWLASWAMSLKRPSDLGYSDDGYLLPPLEVRRVTVPADYVPPGQLFAAGLKGITDRAHVRRQTLKARVTAAAGLIDAERQPWIAWVGLNDEGRQLAAELGDQAVLVEGAMAPEDKAERLTAFVQGQARVLVSKTSIAGFGLNLQHCARQVFVGLSDSWEQYYQAVRRCWRYGQTSPVHVYVVVSEPEAAVHDNVLRKEREAEALTADLIRHVAAYERAEVGRDTPRIDPYTATQLMAVPGWPAREEATCR